MGMYDEVQFRCPRCKETILIQSKAGECSLGTFLCKEVPLAIADDIQDDLVYCESCGARSRVFMPVKIETIQLELLEIN